MMDERDERDLVPMWQEFMANEERSSRTYRRDVYQGIVEAVKEAYPETQGLPTPILMNLMHTESSLDPTKVSKKGAVGLMQVLPSTHEWLQGKLGYDVGSDLQDPYANIASGMMYLNYLQKRFKTIDNALHAYNVGPTNFLEGARNPRYVRKIKEGR